MTTKTHRPNRRRALVAPLTLMAALIVAPSDGPHVALVRGGVEIGRGEPPVWQDAQPGDALTAGDRVRTARNGRAEISLQGDRVRLYGDSVLRLPPAPMATDAPAVVDLEEGRSLFDVLRRSRGERFEVHTPEVVVSVKGTRFGVSTGAEERIAVFEGTVGVRGPAARSEVLVREGFAAVGGIDGPFELSVHGAADPWEGWSRAAEPEVLSQAPAARATTRRASLEQARQAARTAAEPDVMRRAIARNPGLAARARKSARTEAANRASVPPDAGAAPDSVIDAQQGALVATVNERFIESRVNGGLPASAIDAGVGGVAGDSALEIDLEGEVVLFSFGDDRFQISAAGLANLLDAGNLPVPLRNLLTASGTSDQAFEAQLQTLIGALGD